MGVKDSPKRVYLSKKKEEKIREKLRNNVFASVETLVRDLASRMRAYSRDLRLLSLGMNSRGSSEQT